MTLSLSPKPNIKKIKKYVPGKSKTNSNKKTLIKLSSNENALGPSKNVINKIQKGIDLVRYPDGNAYNLRKKIAEKYKINIKNIICGNGSDELFFLIAYAYSGINDEVLHSKHGFLIYPIAARAAGAEPIAASENNLKSDVKSLLALCSKKTRICFLANPNNPTGSYLNISEIKELRQKLPKNCLLVIDAAYSEYVTNNDYNNSLSLAKTRSDIIVTHTFSKIFGIPSLRLGWAFCPEKVIVNLNKIRPAFNINSYAQKAGIEALEDKKHVKQSILHNTEWKKWLENNIQNLGLKIQPSVANFVLIKFKNRIDATNCAKFLEKNNILVRTLEDYKLESYLRVTVGLKSENIIFLNTVKNFLKTLKRKKK